MNQMLLLVSVLIALFLMSTKEGKKVAKDVSKSVSSVAGQKGKGGFPSGLVLLLVLVALLCLSRKGLVEGTGDDGDEGTGDDGDDGDGETADDNESVDLADPVYPEPIPKDKHKNLTKELTSEELFELKCVLERKLSKSTHSPPVAFTKECKEYFKNISKKLN